MKKRVESVADLQGYDALTIPDLMNLHQPADAVAWLQKKFGGKYEFADPARIVQELTTKFARKCREEWSEGV